MDEFLLCELYLNIAAQSISCAALVLDKVCVQFDEIQGYRFVNN